MNAIGNTGLAADIAPKRPGGTTSAAGAPGCSAVFWRLAFRSLQVHRREM